MNKQRALTIVDAWANNKDVVWFDSNQTKWKVSEIDACLGCKAWHRADSLWLPDDAMIQVMDRTT